VTIQMKTTEQYFQVVMLKFYYNAQGGSNFYVCLGEALECPRDSSMKMCS